MQVSYSGFDKLRKKLNASEQSIHRNLVGALHTSVTVIQAAAKNKAPIGATRNLSRSIQTNIDERRYIGTVGLAWPGSQYGKFVEFGTRPHWAPIRALERWAKQRGISPFAIQRAIARKGTKAHPFMTPAYKKNITFVKQQFRKALSNITNDLGK